MKLDLEMAVPEPLRRKADPFALGWRYAKGRAKAWRVPFTEEDLLYPQEDAPCPACGTLLWFIQIGDGTRFFDPNNSELAALVADRLGVRPEQLHEGRCDELGVDSLDLADLLMELDERGW